MTILDAEEVRIMPQVIGARELKTRLGRYLSDVKRGQTIVVTDRGQPVAELRPIALSRAGDTGRLDRLVVLGRLSRRSKTRLRVFHPIRHRGPSLAKAIEQDREDRF
jgi:prevent-host-death family protein